MEHCSDVQNSAIGKTARLVIHINLLACKIKAQKVLRLLSITGLGNSPAILCYKLSYHKYEANLGIRYQRSNYGPVGSKIK